MKQKNSLKMMNLLKVLTFMHLILLPMHGFSQDNRVDAPVKNFDHLWEEFANRYAFFELKNIDWNETYKEYRPLIHDSTTNDQLFSICSDMLGVLNDGHVSLSDTKNENHYSSVNMKGFLTEFSKKDSIEKLVVVIDSTLIKNGFSPLKQVKMKIAYLSGSILEYSTNSKYGYLRVNLMIGISKRKLRKALDIAMEQFRDVNGVIIDVRFNSGGYDKYAYEIAGRFVDMKRIGHYKCTKKKGGFSPMKTWYLEPTGSLQIVKPIVLLTSSLSMSATDVFALAMKELPYLTIIGDNTNGIFSDMYESKLPNGWKFTLSFQAYYSADMKNYEGIGVSPEIRILNTLNDLKEMNDPILDKAIEFLEKH